MSKTGGCLCGAVRFEITSTPTETGACHCGMCRKVSGGVFLGVRVAKDDLRFTKTEWHAVYTSSPWAERGFCSRCGSTLYYRVTAEGDHQGTFHVGLGAFDDPDGIKLRQEIYVDHKPDGYDFAGDIQRITEAEVLHMLSVAPG